MIAHYFSNLAVPMTITANMDASQTTMVLNSLAGLPASYPYFLVIERDTADIEMVEVTSLSSGTTVNVVRGFGDTTGVAHTSGDPVLHVAPAEFYTDVLAQLDGIAIQDAAQEVSLLTKVTKMAARTTTISVANTETEVVGFEGDLVVGETYRFVVQGVQTNTTAASTSIWRIRVGGNTMTGAAGAAWTCVMGTVARTNVPFTVIATVTILSATTCIGNITVIDNATTAYATPSSVITAPVTITSLLSMFVQLTVISGATTTTWNCLTATEERVAA